jgi:hypothetical protein
MKRWLWFSACALLGLGMLVCGLLMPAHLRAVDASVLARAGRDSPSLPEQGLALVQFQQLGAAQLLLLAAQREGLPDRRLALALDEAAKQNPLAVMWGGADVHLARLFETDATAATSSKPEPLADFLIRTQNRELVLGLLPASRKPVVQELLRFRQLTNTVLFAPSLSAAGQALDTALCISGLLFEGGYVRPGLSNAIFSIASATAHGGSSQPLEEALLDMMSLAQRLNWGQLVAFIRDINDIETLRLLATFIRQDPSALPVIFSAVFVSRQPALVSKYLADHGQTGLQDLGSSLRFGAGGVQSLLERDQRISTVNWGPPIAAGLCWRTPVLALGLKWLCYLVGGFLIAIAFHFVRPAVSGLEQPLQVRGFHFAREILFALGFLVMVLFLSEPFLSQDVQKVEFPLRLRLPTSGSVAALPNANVKPSVMNEVMLLTLLLFFVLQALLYTASLLKLAEIRRQRVPAYIKLKLLENEDHLFDAGLYLGFAGTIISLILVSMGIFKLSLMAAYSSTSFGIIFVSIFKICHLRPARRRLLLEAEAAAMDALNEPGAPSLALPS